MVYAVVSLFVLAFLSSSASLALLAALRRRDGSELALYVIRFELCIIVVLVANAVEMARESFGAAGDLVLEFSLMSVVVIALERSSRYLVSVAALAIGTRPSARLLAGYHMAAAALYIAVAFSSLVIPSRGGSLVFKNEDGFALSAYFGGLVGLACGTVVFLSGRRLEAGSRKTIFGATAPLMAISLFSFANEAFDIAELLGLAQLPLSPLLLVAQNLIVIRLSSRALAKGAASATEAREEASREAPGFPRVFGEGDPALEAAAIRLASGSGLSEREREVLRLMLAGADNGRIAETLFISTFTVKNHVHSVFKKTGATSRIELLRIAGGNGPRAK